MELAKIASFSINHLDLMPGIYVSRKDPVGGDVVTTFDLRMTAPNREPVMSTAEVHTFEHLGAVFLRSHETFKDKILYFGPMGCRTGCYLLMIGDYEPKDILSMIIEMCEFIRDYKGEVPAAHPRECGNYLDQNANMAAFFSRKYLDVLYHIDEFPESRVVYPE